MKQVSLTLAVFCASCAFVFAGPEPMHSSKEVVQPVVEAESCFAGWYFGFHAGATYSNFDQDQFASEESIGAQGNGFVEAEDRGGADDGGSFVGGLHMGYNWTRGHFLFGIEGDLSATALNENGDAVAAVFLPNNEDVPFTTAVEAKSTIDWFSTLRPRLGWTFGDRFLAFITGGVAVGNPELHQKVAIFALREENPSIDRNGGFDEDRDIKWGWTVGGGLEFCVSRHITLNVTYLYTDLEDSSTHNDIFFISDDIPREFDTHASASSSNSFHTLTGGLSFHF